MAKQIPEPKLNRADGGFSLLEVIISMAILALVTIPLLQYFTDSLKHSAQMAQQQQGTLAAQELTEGLKSVDKLIVVPENSTDFTVPYLTGLFGASLIKTGNFDSDGKGSVIYEGIIDEWTCSNCGYIHKSYSAPSICPACNQNEGFSNSDSNRLYARVTISTSVAANAVSRPLIYGIDDSTDLLALEHNQETEALVYFTSVNTIYCAGHPSVSALTQDQIADRLNRTIHVEADYDGTNYNVKVYYEYKCSGLREPKADGSPSEDSYISNCLVDSKINTLKNLYVLYNRMGSEDRIVLNINIPKTIQKDGKTVSMSFTEENMYSGSDQIYKNSTLMGLYLIAQGLKDSDAYTLKIENYDDEHYTSIHTNIVGPNQKLINANTNTQITPFLMKSSGTPTRLIEITTEIYKDKENVPDDPLAVVNTTKGE